MVDDLLDVFETRYAELGRASDREVMAAVEWIVLGLNRIDADFAEDAISTDGRELFCEYIDAFSAARGVDLDALAGRLGIGRHEITDEWRAWQSEETGRVRRRAERRLVRLCRLLGSRCVL